MWGGPRRPRRPAGRRGAADDQVGVGPWNGPARRGGRTAHPGHPDRSWSSTTPRQPRFVAHRGQHGVARAVGLRVDTAVRRPGWSGEPGKPVEPGERTPQRLAGRGWAHRPQRHDGQRAGGQRQLGGGLDRPRPPPSRARTAAARRASSPRRRRLPGQHRSRQRGRLLLRGPPARPSGEGAVGTMAQMEPTDRSSTRISHSPRGSTSGARTPGKSAYSGNLAPASRTSRRSLRSSGRAGRQSRRLRMLVMRRCPSTPGRASR